MCLLRRKLVCIALSSEFFNVDMGSQLCGYKSKDFKMRAYFLTCFSDSRTAVMFTQILAPVVRCTDITRVCLDTLHVRCTSSRVFLKFMRSCFFLHLFLCRAKTVAKEQSSAITTRDGMVVVSFFLPVTVTKVRHCKRPPYTRNRFSSMRRVQVGYGCSGPNGSALLFPRGNPCTTMFVTSLRALCTDGRTDVLAVVSIIQIRVKLILAHAAISLRRRTNVFSFASPVANASLLDGLSALIRRVMTGNGWRNGTTKAFSACTPPRQTCASLAWGLYAMREALSPRRRKPWRKRCCRSLVCRCFWTRRWRQSFTATSARCVGTASFRGL